VIRDEEPEVRAQAELLLRHALEIRAGGAEVRLGGACWLYRGVAR
jgi:hypothetical protein